MIHVYIETLGCPRNIVGSEIIAHYLEAKGLKVVDSPQIADVLIINTCAFIKDAELESRERIHTLRQTYPHKKIIVTGCLPERYGCNPFNHTTNIIATSQEDLNGILNAILYGDTPPVLPLHTVTRYDYLPRKRLDTYPYAYVEISRGCNRDCTFCTIPQIKGKLRSKPINSIIHEATQLIESGVKEIILVAQDLTSYGEDLYGEPRLLQLVERLAELPDLYLLRLLYLHPTDVTVELVQLVNDHPKLASYLHIPIQHVSTRILKLMGRQMSRKDIDRLLDTIARYGSSLSLRTDIIAGFPTETDTEFDDLIEFIMDSPFRHINIFPFSCEPHTLAAELPQLPKEVIDDRTSILTEIAREKAAAINSRLVGSTLEVIIDEPIEVNTFRAHSEYECPEVDTTIYVEGDTQLGSIEKVKVITTFDYEINAKLLA